jgi:tRNA-intron endonuclease
LNSEQTRERVKAYFYKTRVIVWDIEDASKLFSLGFFGKPLGVPKPKGPDFDSPLILDLLEALYLAEKGYIEIVDAASGEVIKPEDFIKLAKKSTPNFLDKYTIYSNLRDSGLVVTSGIKFGADFAVYKRGPGLEHAPYIVKVVRPNEVWDASEMIRAGRLATTVRKRFIIAFLEEGEPHYLLFEWWRP